MVTITQQQADDIASYMDGDVREEIHAAVAPCSPGEWLAAAVARLGQEAVAELAEMSDSAVARAIRHDDGARAVASIRLGGAA